MHAQLADVIAALDAASARLKVLSARLTPDVWNRRPSPNQWSPAECVAHLNLTSEAFLPRLRAGLDEAKQLGSAPRNARFGVGFMGWLVRMVSGPRRWMAIKTPAAFVPTGDRPGTELVARFERLQDELVGLVRAADGFDVGRVTITSPFDSRVRYSVYAALATIPGHQIRHLLQAESAANGR